MCRDRLEAFDPGPLNASFTGIADRHTLVTVKLRVLVPMPTRQTICAIDDLAALQGQPVATLILGTLLLLTRP